MELSEISGDVASALVLATFTMRTMIPLRLLGIGSNIAFITYGNLDDLVPVVILHAILLPPNLYRLIEIQRLIKEVERAETESDQIKWLLPFMKPMSAAAGSTLFRKGEPANEMYLLRANPPRGAGSRAPVRRDDR